MKSRSIISLAALLTTWLVASPAFAQIQTQESSVLGWTASNSQIVVRSEYQGEVIEDDAAKTYYFETTDLYSAQAGTQQDSYQHGELVGAIHPAWKQAKPAAEFDPGQTKPAVKSWASPDGRYFLGAFSESTRTQASCSLRERLVVFDSKLKRVFVVVDSASQQPDCVFVSYAGYWHPGSTHFAVERHATDGWGVITKAVNRLDALQDAPFESQQLAASVFLTEPKTTLSSTWEAIFGWDYAAAMQAVGKVAGPEASQASIVRFLILALKGAGKEAGKGAKAAYKKSNKSAFDEALLAAVYTLAGNKRGAKHIKKASKKAQDFLLLSKMGALFSLADLSLSNQLMINALSHETAASHNTDAAYALLVDGLIDAGEYDAAAEVLGRFKEPSTAMRLLDLRLKFIRKNRKAAALALQFTFDSPGQCGAYALAAQASATSNPALALQQFRAAAFCNPDDAESHFYLADFAIRRGELEDARGAFSQYLQKTTKRRHDPVRQVRRAHAESMLPRLGHQGVVLLNVSCRGVECRGTLINNQKQSAQAVVVEAIETRVKRKKTVKKRDLGRIEIAEILPGELASFSLTLKDSKAKIVAVTAGVDRAERTLNLTRPK